MRSLTGSSNAGHVPLGHGVCDPSRDRSPQCAIALGGADPSAAAMTPGDPRQPHELGYPFALAARAMGSQFGMYPRGAASRLLHKLVRPHGTRAIYRAKKAATFTKISRSSSLRGLPLVQVRRLNLLTLPDGADGGPQVRWKLVQDCDGFESPRARIVTLVSGCCSILGTDAMLPPERVRKSLEGASTDSRKRQVKRWIPQSEITTTRQCALPNAY